MAKYSADKLFDDMMAAVKAAQSMEIKDEASVAEYFKLQSELVFNHKLIGNIFDMYADGVKIYRENGVLVDGPHAMMKDTLKLTSAFPDMVLTMRDTFAKKVDEETYKLWRYYTLSGHNLTYSVYGPATEKTLNGDACINMSMATVKLVNGRWQIVKEFTMYSIDEIRNTCTTEAAEVAEPVEAAAEEENA